MPHASAAAALVVRAVTITASIIVVVADPNPCCYTDATSKAATGIVERINPTVDPTWHQQRAYSSSSSAHNNVDDTSVIVPRSLNQSGRVVFRRGSNTQAKTAVDTASKASSLVKTSSNRNKHALAPAITAAVGVRGGSSEGPPPTPAAATKDDKSGPRAPSKIATAAAKKKKNASFNSAVDKSGGVWGSMARGAAAAWRTVRRRPEPGPGRHPRAVGSGAAASAAAGGTASSDVGVKETAGSGGAETSHNVSSPRVGFKSSSSHPPSSSSGAAVANENNGSSYGLSSGGDEGGKPSPGRGKAATKKGVYKRSKSKGRSTSPSSSSPSSPSTRNKKNIYGAAAGASSSSPPSVQQMGGGFGGGAGGGGGYSYFPGMRGSITGAERERRELEVREGLKRTESELGSEHPRVGAHLFLLSRMVQERGAYSEAEELCGRALDIYEQALGPEHPDVGVALNCLALSWQAQVGSRQK